MKLNAGQSYVCWLNREQGIVQQSTTAGNALKCLKDGSIFILFNLLAYCFFPNFLAVVILISLA